MSLMKSTAAWKTAASLVSASSKPSMAILTPLMRRRVWMRSGAVWPSPAAAASVVTGQAAVAMGARTFSTTVKPLFQESSVTMFSTTADRRFRQSGVWTMRGSRSPYGDRFARYPGPMGFGFGPWNRFARGPFRFPLFRVFFGIMAITSFFVFIAAPFFFIMLPLFLIFGVGMSRFKANANKMQTLKAMTRLRGTTLKYRPADLTELISEDQKFKKFITNRIRIFVEDAEQDNDLMRRFKIANVNSISLKQDYTSIQQQWVQESDRLEKLIVLLRTELYDVEFGEKIADVEITAKLNDFEESFEANGEVDIKTDYDVVVELVTRRRRYLINTGVDNSFGDRVIDLKNYKVRNVR